MSEHHPQLEKYEVAAAEFEILARLTMNQSKRQSYARLADHYRDLATGFREGVLTLCRSPVNSNYGAPVRP